MILRFIPDNWVDVVMRPFDMAAPEANTYVEIAAPDLRFAASVLLAFAVLVLWRRRSGAGRPAMWLLALLLVSTAPWLATTGNGRYFIAWLVLLGPLCIGLIRLLPLKAGAKLLAGGLLVAAQIFVLTQDPPWDTWAWSRWKEPPYFQIDPPPAEPATYVTIANISYSLVAPQFPPQSRWIGLASGIDPRDAPRVAHMLSSAARLRLLAPALPGQILAHGQPSQAAAEALDLLLRPYGLSLSDTGKCQLLHSGGLVGIGMRKGMPVNAETNRTFGFWLCPLDYRPHATPAPADDDPAVDATFEAVERLCPRFFPSGGLPTRIAGAWLKNYDSDTKVYVTDEGTVAYKFWRSINPVVIGSRQQLLAGRAAIDCTKIRAPNWRHGGP